MMHARPDLAYPDVHCRDSVERRNSFADCPSPIRYGIAEAEDQSNAVSSIVPSHESSTLTGGGGPDPRRPALQDAIYKFFSMTIDFMPR